MCTIAMGPTLQMPNTERQLKRAIQTHSKCAFGYQLKSQLILLFSLFLLLFTGPTALFDTIHKFYYTISANFYLYLQYFQQKKFSFRKISGSQMDPKITKTKVSCNGAYLKFYFAVLVLVY